MFLRYFALHRGHHRARSCARVDHHYGERARRWELRCRGKDHSGRLATKVAVFRVRDDADDGVDSRRIISLLLNAQCLSDGVGAGQESADEGLIHECHWFGCRGIVLVEVAADNQGDSHGLEVAWTDPGELRYAFGRCGVNAMLPTAAEQGRVGCGRRAEYAGNRAHLGQQLPLELLIAARWHVRLLKGHECNRDTGLAHPRIESNQLAET